MCKSNIDLLVDILPDSKQDALNAIEIADNLTYSTDGNQVKTRELIKLAISEGSPI